MDLRKKDMVFMPEFYDRYIKLVPDNLSVIGALEKFGQLSDLVPMDTLEQIGNNTYAKDKWTIKQILQHLIDMERVLAYRALRIARNDSTPLPGVDENSFAVHVKVGDRSIPDLLSEFSSVRQATIFLFESFGERAAHNIGVTGGREMNVLALGFIIAGHAIHHFEIIKDKYVPLIAAPLGDDSIKLLEYSPEYKIYFDRFNRAWLTKYFTVETVDEYVLSHPEEAILNDGGHILFAQYQNKIIGTVALKNMGNGVMEMTKMAVDEPYRGLGAGKFLCKAAIERSRELMARKLILYSQTKLSNALSIYRKNGFRDIPVEAGKYERADVMMELSL